MVYTVLKLKAPFRYRAQSLGIAAFSIEYKVLFDTFSFKKKYEQRTYDNHAPAGAVISPAGGKDDA